MAADLAQRYGTSTNPVREALQQYASALESLDAEAVKKVQPSIDVEGLKRAFREMRSLEVAIDNIRLLCRTHNQFEAERVYGAEFMKNKREAAAEARARKEKNDAMDRDIIAGLKTLGYKAADAKRAAESCRNMPGATLEERFRVAFEQAPYPMLLADVQGRIKENLRPIGGNEGVDDLPIRPT